MAIQLINNTKSVSKIGYLVSVDPTNNGAFIYTTSNASKAIGVVTEASAYRSPCKIATIGDKTKVYVATNLAKGDIIRSAKSLDNISLGTCTTAKPLDAPYLKIGDALESGSGLITTVLELTFAGDAYGAGYVPYTGATKDINLGENNLSVGSPTSYTNIDENGNIALIGDATVWDDLRILYGVVDVPGGTDPDIIDWQPAGAGTTYKVYGFAKGDQFFFTQQLPHDYKEGSNLYPHVHWTPASRGNEESGNTVQWRLDYSIVNHEGNFIASQTVALPGVCAGVDHRHEKTPAGTISGVGLEISAQLIGRFYRFNDASDTWAGTGANLPIFLELDFHYTKDSLGSRTITGK